MIIEKKKPTSRMIHMRSETTRLAESRTKYVCMVNIFFFQERYKSILFTNYKIICQDTTQELMPDDIKYSYEYGGEKVSNLVLFFAKRDKNCYIYFIQSLHR
jgi:hypothetical protein